MTAQQYSSAVSQKTMTYASTVETALDGLGYSVVFSEPDVTWTEKDLVKYEKVFVGVSSPVSLTANCTYGAFSLISVLNKNPKLVVFVDAPEPGKIFAGLRSIQNRPDSLLKPFYSRRRGYRQVADDKKAQDRVYGCVDMLLEQTWPTTLFPTLPWERDPRDVVGIKQCMVDSMLPLSFDSMYLSHTTTASITEARKNVWGIDVTSTKWAESMKSATTLPHEQIKNTKTMSDSDVNERISSFFGVLLTSYEDKRAWWSPRFVQALNAGTPIVTDWRRSHSLGVSWSHLAGAVEKMSQIDRYELSVLQQKTYRDSVQSKEEALTLLKKVVDQK